MLTLDGTPYVLSFSAEREIEKRIGGIEARVVLLRSIGKLSPDTLRRYYGEKRFEQIAESNAIEGSTLSVGETQAAVLKGITLTGHDPAYVRDARSLDAALSRVVELSKDTSRATDITQLAEVHALIMGDRPGGGIFRSEMVKISGSSHTPPKTWKLVMEGMEAWEGWSIKYKEAPAPFRAATLHAWLTHIHPFMDGNGRASRAIMNLELIRAGYPPIIVRKKERDRYIDSLSQSDSGGDILAFLELILERTDGALCGLETSASEKQEYSPVEAKLKPVPRVMQDE